MEEFTKNVLLTILIIFLVSMITTVGWFIDKVIDKF